MKVLSQAQTTGGNESYGHSCRLDVFRLSGFGYQYKPSNGANDNPPDKENQMIEFYRAEK